MIKKPHILIVGAASRNVGKTEFACRVIKNETPGNPVIGIKITSSKKRDGKCTKGEVGCGICEKLDGNYEITEEKLDNASTLNQKDTVRMLNAGASKVYWLKVLRSSIEEGVEELLKLVPENACVVCESNSLRKVVEPGLFLVIKKMGDDEIKHSCRKVIGFADRVIEFNGSGWDFPPENIMFYKNKWKIMNDNI